jgi:hypothetical protein
MSSFRFILMPVVAGGFVLLTGSVGLVRPGSADAARDTAPPPAHLAPPTRSAPNAAAVAALDRTLTLLDPGSLHWLEMGLWQQVSAGGVVCEAEGRYLLAPGPRFRLELKTRHGTATGSLMVVGDGTTLWQKTQIDPGGQATCGRVRLGEVLKRFNRPDVPPQVLDEFFRSQGCGSLVLLLPGLRQQLNWVGKERVRRNGRVLVKLSGVWGPAESAVLAPPGEAWPEGLPRQCRLYLDAETSWPHRLEWWGPDPPHKDDALLVQMEFRDPVINRPMSADRCAREFTPDLDPAQVPDITKETIQRLDARCRKIQKVRASHAPATAAP